MFRWIATHQWDLASDTSGRVLSRVYGLVTSHLEEGTRYDANSVKSAEMTHFSKTKNLQWIYFLARPENDHRKKKEFIYNSERQKILNTNGGQLQPARLLAGSYNRFVPKLLMGNLAASVCTLKLFVMAVQLQFGSHKFTVKNHGTICLQNFVASSQIDRFSTTFEPWTRQFATNMCVSTGYV